MDQSDEWSVKDAWHRFRLEAETVRHYPSSYALYVGQTHRDILLEQLLPTLLYIKGASILDDAISVWLSDNGRILKKPYKNDFNGRLCYLGDNSLYKDAGRLHSVRKKRNSYAHTPNSHSNWQELESDISVIEQCLVKLGLANESGKLEYFAERSGMQGSSEPNVAFTRRFSYGVKEDGKMALEVVWDQNVLNE